MISDSNINRIIDAAMSKNADFAEVFLQDSMSTAVSMLDRNVIGCRSDISSGIGIRIMLGTNVVYVYSSDLDIEMLVKMASEAASALKSDSPTAIKELEQLCKTSASVINRDISVSEKDYIDFMRTGIDFALGYDEKISKVTSKFTHSDKTVRIANSRGINKSEHYNRRRAYISIMADNGTEKQTAAIAPGTLKDFDFFTSYPLIEEVQKKCDSTLRMLDAGYAPSGKMPVVIGNGFGGVIFHEACGHTLEATSVGIKSSPFSDKLNQQIASSVVSARDNAKILGEWGSYETDDEGNTSSDLLLIENGILKNFLVDELGARRMNCKPTGCSRRESYKYAPTSRMSNTYICAGEDKPADIISDTEYGLYAVNMGGGSVDTATGEFNFAVNEGYMIRNGQIAEPVRGATLIGKGPEVLMNIDRVADDLELSVGVCGSISGSVPVTVGQPTLRVSNITVGGRD